MNALCSTSTTVCLMFVPKFMQPVFLFSENFTVDLPVCTYKAEQLKLFDDIKNVQNTKTCF